MTLNKALLGRQPKHSQKFSFISVALHMLVYFRDEDFLGDRNLWMSFCS